MKRNILVLSLIVACTLVLAFAMAATAWAETAAPADPWQVRTIATPVTGVQPSFIAAGGGRIAWTGAAGENSRMFVFNLSTGVNTVIPVTLPGSYYNPCADGPWIAYQGHGAGAYDDIYLYDTATAAVRQITDNSSTGDWNDWNPRIQGDRIVWQKAMLGSAAKPGIYLYDIGMETTSLIIAGAEYRDPDIWGNSVVCVKDPPPKSALSSEIVLYDLVTKQMKTIATGVKDNEHPRIDAGRIVWAAGDIWAGGTNPWPTYSYQINLYDVATGVTTPLTNNIAGNLGPSLEGDIVAWQTKQPAGIMSYEFTTKATRQVSAQGDAAGYPEVDGNSIAWFDSKSLYTRCAAPRQPSSPMYPSITPTRRPSRAWPTRR